MELVLILYLRLIDQLPASGVDQNRDRQVKGKRSYSSGWLLLQILGPYSAWML